MHFCVFKDCINFKQIIGTLKLQNIWGKKDNYYVFESN